MSVVLLCSTPVHGHVTPMMQLGADLASRGHRVVMLTGSRFVEAVVAAGMEHVPLPAECDYDDRDMDTFLPERSKQRGLGKARYDIEKMFLRTIPSQAAAVSELTQTITPAVILADSTFAGVLPMLLSDGDRPPVVGIGVVPLSQSSRDLAPYGMGLLPSSARCGRLRNRVLDVLMRKVVFARTQRLADRLLAECDAPPMGGFVLDTSATFDRFLQLSPELFEYPRSDLATNTIMIGSLPLPAAAGGTMPPWWDELFDGRPVLHVTQGTIDNDDSTRLVGPTIDAVADMDVTLVVTTGGNPLPATLRLPDNVYVASFIPYAALLPIVDVMITNGGFGGVQAALANGVPLIVAGDTEEKPEVAARVAWTGAGINLRTGTPSSRQIRTAIEEVMSTPAYLEQAQTVARAAAGYDPLQTVSDELDALIAGNRPQTRRSIRTRP